MSDTCCIKWIGPDGKDTPDDNPSVGVVYREAYIEQFQGRAIEYTETERFPICAEHAKRLDAPGMHHWHFISHVYTSSYCNHGHRVSDGKPIDHECYTLPPDALRAEIDGRTDDAIALIDKAKPLRRHTGVRHSQSNE